jgi:hypothetical protein
LETHFGYEYAFAVVVETADHPKASTADAHAEINSAFIAQFLR